MTEPDTYLPDEQADADRTWLQEYGAAAISIALGLASLTVLGVGYARSFSAGVEFWNVMSLCIRIGTVLACLGTLTGIWALLNGRSVRGLTLCGGLLIACGVLWAWMLGYLYWL
ncbi:MAG: hypothetical protein GVY16_02095 [Planctomycetes bacterium]|jgi:hypothetical protein|nr:hypothetical protein [Planctomycetota bacterium]